VEMGSAIGGEKKQFNTDLKKLPQITTISRQVAWRASGSTQSQSKRGNFRQGGERKKELDSDPPAARTERDPRIRSKELNRTILATGYGGLFSCSEPGNEAEWEDQQGAF